MNIKNKKCIRRLSRRSLWASHKRNIIAIIAIALTTLLFTSLFTVMMSINSSYEMYTFHQIGGYCHGTFKEVTDEQIQAIASHPGVKAVGARTNIGYITSGVFAKKPAEVSFMDSNCTKWSFAEPTMGHQPHNRNEITMDTTALKLLGIEPELGAEITLTYSVGDKSQTAYEKTETFTLVGWWEYNDIDPVHYINISEEYANAIEAEGISLGMEPFRTDLNVMMPSAIDIGGQMEQVAWDLGYASNETGANQSIRIGVNWGYTSSQLGANIDISNVIAIIAFLALVIFTGYLIIYNIFQISVTGDIQFYGLLKTIGVTSRQLRRIIQQQALLLCVVGIPIGLLLGYGIGAVLTPIIMAETTLGASIATVSTSFIIFPISAFFALITVLLSCSRPGKIAAKVSPVEATKHTDAFTNKKKRRATRGAKVYQMAFANLGRNKSKTILVVISLALSVVLLNILATFTDGFDMEKYLERQSCADFIVSSTDYFRSAVTDNDFLSETEIAQIEANTSSSLAGCGYTLDGIPAIGWMTVESWRAEMSQYTSPEAINAALPQLQRRDDMVGATTLIEGLDTPLFEKLTVLDGDITPMLQGDTNAIAIVLDTDDYGNAQYLDYYPEIGTTQTISYIESIYYIDSRTGETCNADTPLEFIDYRMNSHDADYTICAYVTVPHSMSHRYSMVGGYSFVLPVESLRTDSGQTVVPMFYLFDTPDATTEAEAESYLAELTSDNASGLMYESKATIRAEFESFQHMFLLLGGLLCGIIGIVGILNFFNAIMTGIISRKREFAVLQAVGMTTKQLKNMLVYEGLFYALSSALVALILSFIINPLVGNLLENMFWFFSANFTLGPVILAIPMFVLLGWAIPTFMYNQAGKYSIVEQIREV
ncbi:MAG: FtsX-like permease family protein [Lachnospiraceae bacterium]|nr:FtsX-like permease family protein [Lachnospiraceae bacterium]